MPWYRRHVSMLGAIIAFYLAALAWLFAEARAVGRARNAIRIRIGVTGTRGKSSVTRLIAAALAGSGLRVVAKTTGSRPAIIHADGTEELILRLARPRIIEQAGVVKAAAAEGADVLVAEVMALEPENQAVESASILGLSVCVVTNARVDHEAEQGSSPDQVAAALSGSVPAGGVVVCGDGADLPAIRDAAALAGAELRLAPPRVPDALREYLPTLGYEELEENLMTAAEACAAVGLRREAALRSMRLAVPDLGALRSWSWNVGDGNSSMTLWNGFAANDVESSRLVWARVAALGAADARPMVAALNIRADRPERTAQWSGALREGALEGMIAMLIVGSGAFALASSLSRAGVRAKALRWRGPGPFVDEAAAAFPGGARLVGLGNIAGPGEELVAWCDGKAALDGR